MNRRLNVMGSCLLVMLVCTYNLAGSFWTATLPSGSPETAITHRSSGKNVRSYITLGGSSYVCYGSPRARVGDTVTYDASFPNRCRASDQLWAMTTVEKIMGAVWVLLGLVLGYVGFDLFMDAGRRDDRGRAHVRVGFSEASLKATRPWRRSPFRFAVPRTAPSDGGSPGT